MLYKIYFIGKFKVIFIVNEISMLQWFTVTNCLTRLPNWPGNRSIYTDQFAIPALQLLNQFYSFAIQSVKLVLVKSL
jgi:hypothetical protein